MPKSVEVTQRSDPDDMPHAFICCTETAVEVCSDPTEAPPWPPDVATGTTLPETGAAPLYSPAQVPKSVLVTHSGDPADEPHEFCCWVETAVEVC